MRDISIPRMATINATAEMFGLSPYFIRQKVRNGEVVAVKAGCKYLVNVDRLAEYLNSHTLGADEPQESRPHGKENAVSNGKLACMLGCSEREARRFIEHLRRDGVLICSTYKSKGGGYYRPRDSTETAEYFGRQLSRIAHIWAALSPFKRYMKDLPIAGQMALDGLMEGGEQNG